MHELYIITCPRAYLISGAWLGESNMSDNSPESGSSRSSLESYVVDELLSSPNLKMLEANDQIRELQTIIRDK